MTKWPQSKINNFRRLKMEVRTKYYEEIFNSFSRQCYWMVKDVVNYRPKSLHSIRVTLKNGESIDYNIQTESYRFVKKDIASENNEITDMDCRDAFAANLAEHMKMAGCGQALLSEKTGLSTAIISKYLRKKSTPSITSLRKIARALDCLPEELLE